MDVKWWIGIVESKNDPEKRGRVQVRVLGIHTKQTIRDEKTGIGIPTEDLPWAVCSMPLTYGGIAESTVSPPAVQHGAWVVGVSLDGDAYQNLLVLGIISMSMSPLATHNGTDLGLAYGYQQKQLDYRDYDTCDDIYKKAIKYITTDDKKIKANQMLMVLQFLKRKHPDKYYKFTKDSGIELADDNVIAQAQNNEGIQTLLSESFFAYCMDVCENPILAALSYHCGLGKVIFGYSNVEPYIKKYGDPRKNEISYTDFLKKVKTENSDSVAFTESFIQVIETSKNECLEQQSENQNQTVSSDGVTVSSTPENTNGLRAIALPTKSNVITSIYMSENRPEYGTKEHRGIDIRAYSGDAIRSMADGVVVALYSNWGGVLIDHGYGIKTRYLHMRKTYVKVGDKVKVGEQIGESGNMGLPQASPHLHFEVWKQDTKIDPEKFLNENGIVTTRKVGA